MPHERREGWLVWAFRVFFGWKAGSIRANLSDVLKAGAGETGFDSSFAPTASADGKVIVFSSWTWNLVPGDGNGAADRYAAGRCEQIAGCGQTGGSS